MSHQLSISFDDESLVAPPELAAAKAVNDYSDLGSVTKHQLHTKGPKFLKNLAAALGLHSRDYDLRSNRGGMAVSGEVTLHSDDIYLQISESIVGGPGLQLMYRSCKSRQDYCGHQNNFARLADFDGTGKQARILTSIRNLMLAERARKTFAAAPARQAAAPAAAPRTPAPAL